MRLPSDGNRQLLNTRNNTSHHNILYSLNAQRHPATLDQWAGLTLRRPHAALHRDLARALATDATATITTKARAVCAMVAVMAVSAPS